MDATTDAVSVCDDLPRGVLICTDNITLTTVLNTNSSNSMLALSSKKVGGGPSFIRPEVSSKSKKKMKISIGQQFRDTTMNDESDVLDTSANIGKFYR